MQQDLRLVEGAQHGMYIAAQIFRPAAAQAIPGAHIGPGVVFEVARHGQLIGVPPGLRVGMVREQRRRHGRHAARVRQKIGMPRQHVLHGHVILVRKRVGAKGEGRAQIVKLPFVHARKRPVEQDGPIVELPVGYRAGARHLV